MKRSLKAGCIFDLEELKYLSIGKWVSKEMDQNGLSSTELANLISSKKGGNCSTGFISNIKAGREIIPIHQVVQFLRAFGYSDTSLRHYQSEFINNHLPLELRDTFVSPKRSVLKAMKIEQKRVTCTHNFMQTEAYQRVLAVKKENLETIEQIKNKIILRWERANQKFHEQLEWRKRQIAHKHAQEIKELMGIMDIKESAILKLLTYDQTLSYDYINDINELSKNYQGYGAFRQDLNLIIKNNTSLKIYDLPQTLIETAYTCLSEFSKETTAPTDRPYIQDYILGITAEHMDFSSLTKRPVNFKDYHSFLPEELAQEADFLGSFSISDQHLIFETLHELANTAVEFKLNSLPETLIYILSDEKYAALSKRYIQNHDAPADINQAYINLFNSIKKHTESFHLNDTTYIKQAMEKSTLATNSISFKIFGYDLETLKAKKPHDKDLILSLTTEKLHQNSQQAHEDNINDKLAIESYLMHKIPQYDLDLKMRMEYLRKDDFGSYIISESAEYL